MFLPDHHPWVIQSKKIRPISFSLFRWKWTKLPNNGLFLVVSALVFVALGFIPGMAGMVLGLVGGFTVAYLSVYFATNFIYEMWQKLKRNYRYSNRYRRMIDLARVSGFLLGLYYSITEVIFNTAMLGMSFGFVQGLLFFLVCPLFFALVLGYLVSLGSALMAGNRAFMGPGKLPWCDDFEDRRRLSPEQINQINLLFYRNTQPVIDVGAIQAKFADACASPPSVNPLTSNEIAAYKALYSEQRADEIDASYFERCPLAQNMRLYENFLETEDPICCTKISEMTHPVTVVFRTSEGNQIVFTQDRAVFLGCINEQSLGMSQRAGSVADPPVHQSALDPFILDTQKRGFIYSSNVRSGYPDDINARINQMRAAIRAANRPANAAIGPAAVVPPAPISLAALRSHRMQHFSPNPTD